MFKRRLSLIILCCTLAGALSGCSGVSDLIHGTQEYITSLQIGEPEIVKTQSLGKYGYTALNEEEKLVYDQIYSCITQFKEKVPLSTKSEDVVNKAFSCIMGDYGELFWVKKDYNYMVVTHGDYVTGIEFSPVYTMDKDARDSIMAEIETVADSWLSDLPADADDYTKSKHVFLTLIKNVDYVRDAPDNQNIISVFLNKETVCLGFAQAANYLFTKLGIPAFTVTGMARDEMHAWNLINLDGDYYYFDATWGSSSFHKEGQKQEIVDFSYLNATTRMLESTHVFTEDTPIELPICIATRNNYFVREGLYFDTFDVDAIGNAINKAYIAEEPDVSLMFSEHTLYSEAIRYFLEENNFKDYCPGLRSISYLKDPDMDVLTLYFR